MIVFYIAVLFSVTMGFLLPNHDIKLLKRTRATRMLTAEEIRAARTSIPAGLVVGIIIVGVILGLLVFNLSTM